MPSKVTMNFSAKKIERAMKPHIEAGIEALNAELLKRTVKKLGRDGTGIHHPGQNFRSSAPGNPPTVQTGRLWTSWKMGVKAKVKKVKGVGYVSSFRQNASVSSPVKYGKWLEDGFDHHITEEKIRRRYLGGQYGAVAIVQRQAQKIFTLFFQKGLGEANKLAGGNP